jgi:flagellar biosynthesis protein FlhG
VVSVMLAAVAAERGREVLLLDGEQNLANLHVLLGLGPRGSLESVLDGQAKEQDLVQPVAANLWLLPAESGTEGLYALEALERARLHSRLVELCRRYEVVVVDAGAGIEGVVRAAMLGADRVLVVTAPEPTALMDAHALVKILSLQAPHLPVDVFVNRCADQAEGEAAFARLAAASEQFLSRRLTLAGVLLEEPAIGAAVRDPRRCLPILMETRAADTIREARLDAPELAETTRSRV